MQIKPISDAPRDGEPIVILTLTGAHRAEWQADYSNFWSLTADRPIIDGEIAGWVFDGEWKHFAVTGA